MSIAGRFRWSIPHDERGPRIIRQTASFITFLRPDRAEERMDHKLKAPGVATGAAPAVATRAGVTRAAAVGGPMTMAFCPVVEVCGCDVVPDCVCVCDCDGGCDVVPDCVCGIVAVVAVIVTVGVGVIVAVGVMEGVGVGLGPVGTTRPCKSRASRREGRYRMPHLARS